MSRVTIYLEQKLAEEMRRMAEREGVSQSRWLARLVENRLRDEWSTEVRSLSGAWLGAPEAEELRGHQGSDTR